ncbi:MAG: aspartate-semialdehyde dehydrogenase, partial [Calditrichaeota bacterium]
MNKIKVAILGATGTVGQRFIQLLENHPWFEISELLASSRSAGKSYSDAVSWKLDSEIPNSVKNLIVKSEDEIEKFTSQIAFSGLDASVAGDLEFRCANSGMAVVSNARNFRMEKEVPLLIP